MEAIGIALANVSGPAVELPTAKGEIDLHNFADFDHLEYSTNGILTLIWRPTEAGEFRLGGQPLKQAALRFTDVLHFSVSPRDVSVPISEDRTLEEFEVTDLKSDYLCISFRFLGGVQIQVKAVLMGLLVDFETHRE